MSGFVLVCTGVKKGTFSFSETDVMQKCYSDHAVFKRQENDVSLPFSLAPDRADTDMCDLGSTEIC